MTFHSAGGACLKVYILDVQSKIREQMLKWLSENKKVEGVEVFEDYVQFVGQVTRFPPDFCFIRLGKDGIPGMKAAGMVQQISSDIRIVFVSDDRDYAVDAYEVGAHGYLICPLKKEKLNKCLARKSLQ